jgi:hypothetical protein
MTSTPDHQIIISSIIKPDYHLINITATSVVERQRFDADPYPTFYLMPILDTNPKTSEHNKTAARLF